jgi:F-type H+-transporting ATPase subunit a
MATPSHAAAAHAASEHVTHAAEHASHGHPEVVNWVQLLARSMAPSPVSDFLVTWEKAIFSFIIVGILAFFAISISRKVKLVPGRAQAFLEMLITGLDDVVQGVMGSRGRKYTPFVGSLFIYIFASNIFGLVPLQNSTMAFLTTVVPLSVCVFLYVQWIGITQNGILGYLHHLAGSPRDIFGWLLVPLMFPLHVLGEFIKPLSLSFRLYGNIMAGHLLLAVFMGMGIEMLKPLHVPVGIPLHFPFLFLEILVGVIQAFVFTLLSTIYIAMMLPHEHEHEHAHAHAEAETHKHH